jgi:hypothetical protein
MELIRFTLQIQQLTVNPPGEKPDFAMPLRGLTQAFRDLQRNKKI